MIMNGKHLGSPTSENQENLQDLPNPPNAHKFDRCCIFLTMFFLMLGNIKLVKESKLTLQQMNT